MQLDAIAGYRLSPQQHHFWSWQQAYAGLPSWAQCALLWEGELQPHALRAAIRQTILRHEILRTRFQGLPGMVPLQVIQDEIDDPDSLFTLQFNLGQPDSAAEIHSEMQADINTKVHAGIQADVQQNIHAEIPTGIHAEIPAEIPTEIPTGIHAELHAEIQAIFQAWNQTPPRVDSLPVLHVAVVLRSPQRYLILLRLPSLCADATTFQRLIHEMGQVYAAMVSGEFPDRWVHDVEALADQTGDDPAPMQYADVADWLNELLETQAENADPDRWPTLDRTNEIPFLPFEHQIPQPQAFHPTCLTGALPAPVVLQLESLAERQHVSLQSLLLASWQVVLWQLTEATDRMLHVTHSGRQQAELATALGLLARALPVQMRLDTTQSVCQLLQQVEQTLHDMTERQDVVIGSQTVAPIAFEFEAWEPLSIAQAHLSLIQHAIYPEPFRLRLTCIRQATGLQTALHYDVSRFSAEAIAQIAAYFERVVTAVVTHPEMPLNALNWWNEGDRQQPWIEDHQPIQPLPFSCIHHWVEAQVAQSPDRIAAMGEHETLTYAELNARANQLAHFLRQRGIQPDDRVVLYGDRTLTLLVGLLGILKAGGAYVPIEPGLPTASIAARLQVVQPKAILTHHHLAQTLPLPAPSPQAASPQAASSQAASPQSPVTIYLDADWSQIAECSAENLAIAAYPEQLAYVLFTSGSTGQPKGVAVEHRQLVSYVQSLLPKLAAPEGSHFALVSTLAADLGHTMLFPSWCTGGCLHLMNTAQTLDPEALMDYVRQHPVDYLKIVPSHLKVLLAAAQSSTMLPRRQLILGGETCHWELVEQIRQLAPDCVILNHYGPTETTVGVLTHWVGTRESAPDSGTVPLGMPLNHTQLYLLDGHLRPVPLGVPGDVYVGGQAVSRGYFNRPDLTAIAFMPDPFTPHAGSRMYRTGDIARRRLDGTLEFLGRRDHQVKVRGFRIELGEIETTLRLHPQIQDAVVLIHARESGHAQLVADVVPCELPGPAPGELRDFLHTYLPEPMIPAAFIPFRRFPLTANGKVDRQALLHVGLDSTLSVSATAFVAPESATEVAIAQLWSNVLGVAQVGRYDNFFELGGDSILCIQIVARAAQAGLRFTPKHLFENPTVGALAAVVNTAPVIIAEQGTITGTVPLTPIQHWFFNQSIPHPHHWNQSLLLCSQQSIHVGLLEASLQHLLAHHDALRSRFQVEQGTWRQWQTDVKAEVPLALVDLSAVPECAQARAVQTATHALQQSLNLTEGPLFRVVLFDLGCDRPQRLLFISHHLIVDGVSWRILLSDLQQVYQQLQQQQPVQLPAKTTSFKTWAERLHHHAQSLELEQELQAWLTRLQEPIPALPVDGIPGQDIPGQNTIAQMEVVTSLLPIPDTHALLHEVPAAYQTQINDILLTALVQVMAEWTGSSVVQVDLEGHGREELFEEIDISRTVGWFTTLFPVRLHLPSHQPEAAIKSIKEQLRQVPNQGISYGLLRWLSPSQTTIQMQQLPPSQVRFNYLGQTEQGIVETPLFSSDTTMAETADMGRDPSSQRAYVLDINSLITQEQLTVQWRYSTAIHRRETIEALAQQYLVALRSLIQHCQSGCAVGFTPSDFPDAQLDQDDLDQLLSQLM
ncbi:amino acid adenylation domain-containing protein [Leptolyngbya sp. AN02str]